MARSLKDRIRNAAAEAEEAVQSVKDPELRKIAYDRALGELLGGNSGSHWGPPEARMKSRTATVDDGIKKARPGPMAWLQELVEEGFFAKPKTAKEILERLTESGHHLRQSDITGQLQTLAKQKVLRRKEAPDANGKKRVTFSNW